MKNRFFFTLLSILTLTILVCGKSSAQGYIKILYTGDEDKPYPVIILYLQGAIDTTYENFFTHKIEITEHGFDEIRKSTEERGVVSRDTVLRSPYQFTIIKNGETTIFLTPYLTRIRQIFQKIIKQYEGNNDKRKIIEAKFDQIIGRLKADNKLK